jgi:putative intracellular protease/amidase
MKEISLMDIAIPLYDRFTALDAVGPYDVLQHVPGVRIVWLAHEAGLVRNDSGTLALEATTTFEQLPHPDVVLLPGGLGAGALMSDERFLNWLREAHAHSTWTTSVCTGSLVLGAAGLLNGVRATSNWLTLDALSQFGAIPISERVVDDGKIVTSAGVSAGIDMALWLAGKLASDEVAQSIQLMIEYDPQPPYESGSPSKAKPETVTAVRELFATMQ